MKKILILLLCLTATASAYKANIWASYTQDGTPTVWDSIQWWWYWPEDAGAAEDSNHYASADSYYTTAADVDSFGQYVIRIKYWLASGKRLFDEYEVSSYGTAVSTFDADGGEWMELSGLHVNGSSADTAAFYVSNTAGHAVHFKTSAATKHGLYTQGNTSGSGINAEGGASGSGIYAIGGASNGDGMKLIGQGTGSDLDATLDFDDLTGTLDASEIGTNAIDSTKINDNAIRLAAELDTTDLGQQIELELVKQKLDHLLAAAESDDPADNSVIAKLAASDGDWSGFSNSTDALEALRDRGDAAWTTGAGMGESTFVARVKFAAFGIPYDTGASEGDCDSSMPWQRNVQVQAIDDNAVTAGAIAANAIGASELASNAFTSAEFDATAIAEIADGLWDEDTTGHTGAGTFGGLLYDSLDLATSNVSVSGASISEIQNLHTTTLNTARYSTRTDYWGSVAGSGAYSVILVARDTVNDLNVSDVTIAVYDLTETTLNAGPIPTGNSGSVTVNLDNGDYAVTATANNVTFDTDSITVNGATTDTIEGYGIATFAGGTAAYAVVQGYLTEPGYEYGATERTAAYWDVRFILEDVTTNSADTSSNKVVAAKSYVDTKTDATGLVQVNLLKTENLLYESGSQKKEPTWTMIASPNDVVENPIISLTFKIPADSSSINLGLLLE